MTAAMAKLAYTIEEAAAATGVSEDVLRREIRARRLIAKYPTTRPVIPAKNLEAWLDAAPDERPERAS